MSYRCSHCNLLKIETIHHESHCVVQRVERCENHDISASTSRSCQTTPVGIPVSPPPSYDKIRFFALNVVETATTVIGMNPSIVPQGNYWSSKYIPLNSTTVQQVSHPDLEQ